MIKTVLSIIINGFYRDREAALFGYIRPLVSELKVGEYEYYKSVYCGLCRALGENTGCSSRLSLNYDLVFLALIRMAVIVEKHTVSKKRCMIHPSKKRPVLDRCRALDFCTYATAMLADIKISDSYRDSRGIKKIGTFFLRPYGKMMRRRSKPVGDISETIAKLMNEFAELEDNKVESIDLPADLFGKILAVLFSGDTGEEDSPEFRICYETGFHLGRFIYIADAADDFQDDVKSGNYNPIRLFYGSDEITDTIRKNLYEALLLECKAVSSSVSLLDFSAVPAAGSIIRNTVEYGMPAASCRVLGISGE